jgi:hypothetical protein
MLRCSAIRNELLPFPRVLMENWRGCCPIIGGSFFPARHTACGLSNLTYAGRTFDFLLENPQAGQKACWLTSLGRGETGAKDRVR